MLSCFRMPVERSHHASRTRFVSQDLQTRDIDVCAILDLKAYTAKRVHITRSVYRLGTVPKKVALFTVHLSLVLIYALVRAFLFLS